MGDKQVKPDVISLSRKALVDFSNCHLPRESAITHMGLTHNPYKWLINGIKTSCRDRDFWKIKQTAYNLLKRTRISSLTIKTDYWLKCANGLCHCYCFFALYTGVTSATVLWLQRLPIVLWLEGKRQVELDLCTLLVNEDGGKSKSCPLETSIQESFVQWNENCDLNGMCLGMCKVPYIWFKCIYFIT